MMHMGVWFFFIEKYLSFFSLFMFDIVKMSECYLLCQPTVGLNFLFWVIIIEFYRG